MKGQIDFRAEKAEDKGGKHPFALKNVVPIPHGGRELPAQPPPAQQGMQRQNSRAGGPDGTQNRNHPVGDGEGRAPATAAGHGVAAALRRCDHLRPRGHCGVKGLQIIVIDLDVSGIAVRPLRHKTSLFNRRGNQRERAGGENGAQQSCGNHAPQQQAGPSGRPSQEKPQHQHQCNEPACRKAHAEHRQKQLAHRAPPFRIRSIMCCTSLSSASDKS